MKLVTFAKDFDHRMLRNANGFSLPSSAERLASVLLASSLKMQAISIPVSEVPSGPVTSPPDEMKTEPTTLKPAAAAATTEAGFDSVFKSASGNAPESEDEAVMDEAEELMADAENEAAATAPPKVNWSTKDIDWTEAGSGFKPEPRKSGLVWVLMLALGALGLVLLFLLIPHQQSPNPTVAPEQTGATEPRVAAPEPPQRDAFGFPSPPGTLPPARVKTPKSLNDLKVGDFVVNPRRSADDLILISGNIENVSDNLHRGVRVELDVLDAQGLKIARVNDFVSELAARATWHVLVRTTNARAASARLTGIKEEP